MKIQVAGSGKKLRGLRHGPYRPDLVVLDDIENDEAVRNPEQRDKLEGWLKKTVLHLGGVGQKFDVVYPSALYAATRPRFGQVFGESPQACRCYRTDDGFGRAA